jgi:pantoate--beta-alanine ligase
VQVATTAAECGDLRDGCRSQSPPARIGFVPTMGALHAGHLSLIKLARSLTDVVVVSIFVNPLQFGPSEDYERYPRPLADDLEACRRAGVDLVFAPSVNELYPAGRQVSVAAGPLGTVFEGAARPGHFDGVLTVVLKLLHIVGPDVAIFGQKDAQQLACIRRMVLDLDVDVDVVGAPIIREADGLALSSRNRFLTATDRPAALALSAALCAAAAEKLPACALAAAGKVVAAAADSGLDLDYLALVNPYTMAEVGAEHRGPATMIIAAHVRGIRLIDNADLTFSG